MCFLLRGGQARPNSKATTWASLKHAREPRKARLYHLQPLPAYLGRYLGSFKNSTTAPSALTLFITVLLSQLLSSLSPCPLSRSHRPQLDQPCRWHSINPFHPKVATTSLHPEVFRHFLSHSNQKGQLYNRLHTRHEHHCHSPAAQGSVACRLNAPSTFESRCHST